AWSSCWRACTRAACWPRKTSTAACCTATCSAPCTTTSLDCDRTKQGQALRCLSLLFCVRTGRPRPLLAALDDSLAFRGFLEAVTLQPLLCFFVALQCGVPEQQAAGFHPLGAGVGGLRLAAAAHARLRAAEGPVSGAFDVDVVLAAFRREFEGLLLPLGVLAFARGVVTAGHGH